MTADSAHADDAAAAAVSPTVLYVEDHPVNVLLMQALFTKRPETRLVIATTGEEALRLAATENFDLLLLDLRLPDCHGTQLLPRLRALRGACRAPAVAVTAEDTAGAHEAGFCEIWHKPLDMPMTLLRLDRLLDLPRAQREATVREAESAPHRHAVRAWRLSPPMRTAQPAPAEHTDETADAGAGIA